MSGRNNDERTGARPTDGDSAAAVQSAVESSRPSNQNQSGLSFVVPTEFVELPSGGKYYASGHPLHGQETVEIKFMTAKDEDILTSRSLLKKGLAINRFLQNIIVDKRVKVEDLLVGDKNAMLTAARISGYGAEYSTNTTCPACATTAVYDFDLNEGQITGFHSENCNHEQFLGRVTEAENNTFNIVLPKSEVTVTVRMLTGADEEKLTQAMNSKKKSNVVGYDTNMTDQMRTYIVAVNGSSQMGHIHAFVNAMPAADSRFLRNTYQALMPNFDLRQHFACESCGYEQDMEVPFTADFFWPKQ
mgnify:CR=1 FL=1|tara:strand:+ start:1073 stop:1981 length:909 start_codon:yes stop_codon:yes gene_type:complete